MKLIALCGAAGAGKDTVADMLPARKLAFADTLYREVSEAFGVRVEWLKDRRNKEEPAMTLALCCGDDDFESFCRPTGDTVTRVRFSNQPRSPRQILQWWGDYRRSQDIDYFVKPTRTSIEWAHHSGEHAVVTDLRLPEQYRMVRQLGGQIWQIKRPGYEAGGTGHASDTAGDEFGPDRVVVNSGSVEDLLAAVGAAWEDAA